jgi:hypothetical protein
MTACEDRTVTQTATTPGRIGLTASSQKREVPAQTLRGVEIPTNGETLRPSGNLAAPCSLLSPSFRRVRSYV